MMTLSLLPDVSALARAAALLRIDASEALRTGGRMLAIGVMAWLAIRVLRVVAVRIERSVDDGNPNTDTAEEKRGRTIAQLIRYVGRIVVIVVALLMAINLFIDIGPLLAGAGILGLAVSFGAQSLVKDVISGFFILVEHQFSVGDVIDAAGKSGTVEKMTLRLVTLRDLEGRLHMIPNGEIKVVSNLTRGWSRAVVDISIPLDEDVDRALGIIADEAKKLEADATYAHLFDGHPEVVGLNEVTDTALVIRTLLRTEPGKQWVVGREFRRRITVRFQHESIDSPYHRRRVEVQVQGGEPLAPDQATEIAGGTA